jgi:ATP-dependent Lon protease
MGVKTRQQSKRIFEEEDSENESITELNYKKIKPNEEGNILNHKFKDNIIDEIIKNSVRKLVKKYEFEEDSNIKDEVVKNTKKKLIRDYKYEKSLESENIENLSDEDYEEFFENIDSIHSGTFFERIPIEEREIEFKRKITKEKVVELNQILKELKNEYKKSIPSIVEILELNISNEQKRKLLEKVHNYVNSELMSDDYIKNLTYLLKNIKNENANIKLEEEIRQASILTEFSLIDDYKNKILNSDMPFNNKVIAYTKFETLQNLSDSNSEEYMNQKMWLDNLLSIPYGKYAGEKYSCISTLLKDVDSVLNKNMSFLENPKDQIINLIAQMHRNKDIPINSIGIYGPKGVGKTNLIMAMSEALNRPYRIIPLGGESDSSLLTGHLKTYIGSMPGRIVEILKDTKCMNPIILFDELDKISDDVKGKEIISALIHITDSTINGRYSGDKYFTGIEFDLSKVLFVFTYNDPTKIDKILADRLYKIKVDNYTYKQKLEITKIHLLKNILEQFKFVNVLKINDDVLEYVVKSCNEDPGMRTIKRKLQIIISRINILLLTNKSDNIVKLPYKDLYDYYSEKDAYVVFKEHIDILLKESETSNDSDKPPFGMYI